MKESKIQSKDLKFRTKNAIFIPAGTIFSWSGVQTTYYQDHYTAIHEFDKDHIGDFTLSKETLEFHTEIFEQIK